MDLFYSVEGVRSFYPEFWSILVGGDTYLEIIKQIDLAFIERFLEDKIGPTLTKFAKNHNKNKKFHHFF